MDSKTHPDYLDTSAWVLFLSRFPWLLLLMLCATLTGTIISAFESYLSTSVYLTAFIPMLMGTGGNSGSQASVTVIRALSLGEIGFGDTLRVLRKETAVAALTGAVLAVAAYAKIILIDYLLLKSLDPENAVTAAVVVSITLAATVIAAKLIGCSLPILAKRLRLDPAVMASPIITTIVDTISLALYFRIAQSLIPGL